MSELEDARHALEEAALRYAMGRIRVEVLTEAALRFRLALEAEAEERWPACERCAA